MRMMKRRPARCRDSLIAVGATVRKYRAIPDVAVAAAPASQVIPNAAVAAAPENQVIPNAAVAAAPANQVIPSAAAQP